MSVSFEGRLLFLSDDPALLKAQFAGTDLSLDEAHPLRTDISTDEITPIPTVVHYDQSLARFALAAASIHPSIDFALPSSGQVPLGLGRRPAVARRRRRRRCPCAGRDCRRCCLPWSRWNGRGPGWQK